jgi:hypothetical protein
LPGAGAASITDYSLVVSKSYRSVTYQVKGPG